MISNFDLWGPYNSGRIENRKLLDLANGQSCVRCGRQDGTVVACHFHGSYAHLFGRGAGEKCDDFLSAHLCHICHIEFDDTPLDKTSWETEEARAFEFLLCCDLTLRRLIIQGHLVIA